MAPTTGCPLGAQAERSGAEPAEPAGSSPGARPFGFSQRDFLVPYILLAISMQRAHGYFIEQYLRGLGLVGIDLPMLYRTLRQLEKDGLVRSAWEPGDEGPARRVYSLTDLGRWWLDAGAATLDTYRGIIDRFFGSYRGRGDAGTRRRGDAGTRRRGDAEMGRRGDAETRGRGDGETRRRGDGETGDAEEE